MLTPLLLLSSRLAACDAIDDPRGDHADWEYWDYYRHFVFGTVLSGFSSFRFRQFQLFPRTHCPTIFIFFS